MVTTIQINEKTLQILKKVKEETNSVSYDEAIVKMAVEKAKKTSLAGYLGKKPINKIMVNLRDKNDRQ